MPPPSTEMSGRGSRRARSGRLVVGIAFAIITLAVTSARGIAGLYTDYLWFDSLRFTSVWSGVLLAKIGLALVFTAVLFALLFGNLLVAQRLAPAVRRPGPEETSLAQFHALVEGRPLVLPVLASLVLAFMFGTGAAGRWNEWILYRNSVSFGVEDPLFSRDVGFYVFQLPFLAFVTNWLFATLVLVLIVTAAAYYINGGIRLQVAPPRVLPGVKAHLSVLAGIIALLKASNYFLDRYELVFSTRGAVEGATYTDVRAQLPALNLLIVISVVAALLLVVNIRQQGWTLPLTALGLWFLVAVVAGSIYPAVVQRFRVEPAESTREVEYIARNIEATRAAMGLSDVELRQFAYDEQLSAEALLRNAETIRNVRLWDPQVLQQTYQRLQEVRTFYRFTDVDVDRYRVGGELTQIVLSARELNSESLPAESWENRHLAFTHGYGAVLSPANSVTADGQPDFLVKNIPPQGEPRITEPRLYHGEAIGGFGIVNTGRDEIDYVREDGTAVTNRYDGRGGVGIGSIGRRIAFALRFGDVNPVISGFMRPGSRILYIRDIHERVRTIAPFLRYDHDPYPVVLDGRITWLIDAYTTSDRYPYAQQADTNRVSGGSDLHHQFNYVRNSVKVAIDAYDGTVTLYVVDPGDPIAAAYAKAFPKLFSSDRDVPDELRAHFRYPEDLFRVQTNMWGRYHIGDANEFYSQSDRWNIAQQPGSSPGVAAGTPPGPVTGTQDGPREGRMDPYYLLMRLPGEARGEFLILQPFVPFSADDSRRELSAFMVAKGDPSQYGKLEVFVMPRDRQVDGPAIVNARINQDPEISQLITLLSRAGSEVILGNLVIIPVEQSLIYIRPLYVQATGANAVPELKKVIVAFGDRIAIRDTFQDALVAVFGDAPETREEGPVTSPLPGSPGTSVLPEDVRRLLDDAGRAFAEADAALRRGDPVAYATKVQEGRQAFERAREAAGRAAPAPTTAAPPA